MNIKELLELIKDLPDDMEIILQKDSEGNDYSSLAGVDPDCIYIPETDYNGTVYSTELNEEDYGMEEDEWDEMNTNPKVLVLYPVN